MPNKSAPGLAVAALITTLVALGPLSTDFYLPALPAIAAAVGAAVGHALGDSALPMALAVAACSTGVLAAHLLTRQSNTVRAELVEARLRPTPFDKLRANGVTYFIAGLIVWIRPALAKAG
ncbi:hypothetical protein [Pseudothauera rhizosphaerae]|uniref:Uncharacterized protein n=1 Tax=Pseudothauera rhizosphaerae TaxID=2565932 RepID=A0A4S4AJ48_9RHOO|nr:hypothetical protein [Pseudothauera rhizosphaerae]THF59415.1 hypothetical protein E6O51_15595 [Pseudothauera rhizosphaerae]